MEKIPWDSWALPRSGPKLQGYSVFNHRRSDETTRPDKDEYSNTGDRLLLVETMQGEGMLKYHTFRAIYNLKKAIDSGLDRAEVEASDIEELIRVVDIFIFIIHKTILDIGTMDEKLIHLISEHVMTNIQKSQKKG